MPSGRHKSGSKRKIQRRLPGGNTKTFYKERLPGKAKCAMCGKPLNGVPRKKKLPKSLKRPERPYGGNLCSECMRKVMINKALQIIKQ